MIRTPALLALATALSLAACSQEPAEPAPEASAPSTFAPPSVPSVEVEPTPPDSEAAAAPTPSPSPRETTVATEIPKSIRGRWGLVPADCTSKLGDAKGLLTVSAKQLKFYESVAKLGKVQEAEESRVRATFNYSGEGQAWTQDVVLDVQDGGKTLIRRDYGRDALPGPLKYVRCT